MWRSAKLWIALIALSVCAHGMERARGWCQIGAKSVTTSGLSSSNVFQQSYPSQTVTVYLTGTLTLATLFSNNTGTSKPNPFTAGSDASFFFYAANGRYDVTCTPQNITFSDILLLDLGSSTGITSINSQTGPSITLQAGNTGTDFNISNPSSNTIQVNCPTASASVRGCLGSSDWSTFNGKQAAITATSPLTLSGGTLAITLPLTLAQGGTGQTTQTNAFNALSPLTTKGDLLVYSSQNVRFPVGTNNQTIIADSSQGSGMRWAACAFCQLTDPLGVAHGGTGLTSGTSGGVACYTGSTTLASSSALAVGNPLIGGGAGACPGTTGVFSTYNAMSLAGQGMPAILSSPTLSATQSSTVGPTTAVSSAPIGAYELCFYAVITQAASSSSSLTPKFSWNDGTARSTSTTDATASPQFQAYTGNVAGTVLTGCATVWSAASQNITYTFTYASTGGTAMNFVYTVTAKRIGSS
jgi:hypothetical protein